MVSTGQEPAPHFLKMPSFRPGAIVLTADPFGNPKKRPHVVLAICPTRGIRLCPLSSSPHRYRVNQEPIPARAGGLRRDSWVCATDITFQRRGLFWSDGSNLQAVGQLTTEELLKVAAVANWQVAKFERYRRQGLKRRLIAAP